MLTLIKSDFFQLFTGGFVVGAVALLTMQPGL